MKKLIIAALILAALMFAEYRYIMTNLCPSIVNDHTVHIEFMGQVDEYYVE